MTIKQTVLAALEPVLPNTWAVELPKRPTWPAAVFDVDTEEEKGWVQGGGYDQHVVNLVVLARTVEELDALRPQLIAAMETIPGYMGNEGEGDGEYEDDPEVFGYFLNFRIRTRRT